jgi:hypothetical protein
MVVIPRHHWLLISAASCIRTSRWPAVLGRRFVVCGDYLWGPTQLLRRAKRRRARPRQGASGATRCGFARRGRRCRRHAQGTPYAAPCSCPTQRRSEFSAPRVVGGQQDAARRRCQEADGLREHVSGGREAPETPNAEYLRSSGYDLGRTIKHHTCRSACTRRRQPEGYGVSALDRLLPGVLERCAASTLQASLM